MEETIGGYQILKWMGTAPVVWLTHWMPIGFTWELGTRVSGGRRWGQLFPIHQQRLAFCIANVFKRKRRSQRNPERIYLGVGGSVYFPAAKADTGPKWQGI